jgi:large subunit ribosomal protein L14
VAKASDFVKIAVRQVAPLSLIKKGFKSKALVIRVLYRSGRRDGSYVRFDNNSVILLKKRLTPRGKELIGPITYGLHRRKVVASFLGVV